MRAWLSISVGELRQTSPRQVAERLAYVQASSFATLELAQRHAWEAAAELLRSALAEAPAGWRVLMEYDLLRLEKRADAVLLTDRAIIVLEFKLDQDPFSLSSRRQAEDYALDLVDFHAGCRQHPVVPLLVGVAAKPPLQTWPLWLMAKPEPLMFANAASLSGLLRDIQHGIGEPAIPLDPDAWEAAPYRPVPNVLEAATQLYRRHSVADLAAARADAANLTQTTAAIMRVVDQARAESGRYVVFVTGIPGAGKTLCGLNVVFGSMKQDGAAFLTGNVPLVKVLREALARDAAPTGGKAQARALETAAKALQNVHRFLDEHVTVKLHAPPEHVIVFDEAQRAWDAAQATKKTNRRASNLTSSEPAHTLEIMGRHQDWCVVVALIGNGQEINTGEAGLAEWGRVIEAAIGWRAVAPRRVLGAREAAQCLVAQQPDWLRVDDDLDLTVPMRSVRDGAGAPWVDAVLRGDAVSARQIAEAGSGVPFFLTRSLTALRHGLRHLQRGNRRVGIVASAGARRLRAEGLGVQVEDVANWFLNPWPDVRSSEMLETFATEYDCQGLELDIVGLAWGGDYLRRGGEWQVREFSGNRWNGVHKPENQRFIRNTYRVLLTRARYETVIWVPEGSPPGAFHDRTRPAAEMDAIAEFLLACGARPLDGVAPLVAAPSLSLL